ncbi:hypothetical protein NP233_g7529 [Leucocoprinus birnbaumii]|uniref:DUF6533 domain-containing protein n=1 Tax=Leucocoprinus birnbaumii TaxID=56174 RepID=A0AAD5VQN6_9AGAR|nr:hypothetical protein NP233_g7529 [Leucocoprinus birnbaumii]
MFNTFADAWQFELLSNYRIVAAATVFSYDSLVLLPIEVEDGWSRSRNRSMAAAVYLVMKVFGILYFISTLYGITYPHATRVLAL